MIRIVVVLAIVAHGSAAHARDPRAGGVFVDERPGAMVPLALTFIDAQGARVALGDHVRGRRPVLLVLAYARCSSLCSVVLHGVGEVARRMAMRPGADYELIVVSLDPRETRDEASRKQATLLADLGYSGEAWRWPYLVGDEAAIRALAAALGFHYVWDARTEQFDHPTVIFALTPEGRIARYLHGARFDPVVVETTLRAAAAGMIGAPNEDAIDLLRCFRFDASGRRYGARAERFLQIGGGIVFFLLFGTVVGLVTWERRRPRP